MNKPHVLRDYAASSQVPPSRRGFVRAWVEFWFTPADPLGLHSIRILSGLLFLFWLLTFAGQQAAFFGLYGWFDLQAYLEVSRLPDMERTPAPITWSMLYLAGTDAALLAVIYWTSVCVLVLFTLGFATRITAVLTWVIVASYTANPTISYDADTLLIVLAFYLMVSYLLFGWRQRSTVLLWQLVGSPAAWLLGRPAPGGRDRAPSVAANLALRLLQVHFALILCVSGFHKLQMAEWWSGSSIWYALHPALETTLEQARQHAPHVNLYLSVLSLGAYLGLAWQITFPLFAWRPGRWRVVLLGGAVIGWLATAFLFRLPLFGPAYLIGSLAFLTAEEWRTALSWLLRLPGLQTLAVWVSAEKETTAELKPRRKEAVSAAASRAR